MNSVYDVISDLRTILIYIDQNKQIKRENAELARELKLYDPQSDYETPVNYKSKSLIRIIKETIIRCVVILVVGIPVLTIAFKLLAEVFCLILTIGRFVFRLPDDPIKVKETIYRVAIFFSEKVLEGREGFFSPDAHYWIRSMVGLFTISVIVSVVVAVFYSANEIKLDIKANKRKAKADKELRRKVAAAKQAAMETSENSHYDKLEIRLMSNKSLFYQNQDSIQEICIRTNLPQRYANDVRTIKCIIEYLESGRALDVIGAINQIRHDESQQAIFCETQAARRAQEEAAQEARRAADQAELANDLYIIDQAYRNSRRR